MNSPHEVTDACIPGRGYHKRARGMESRVHINGDSCKQSIKIWRIYCFPVPIKVDISVHDSQNKKMFQSLEHPLGKRQILGLIPTTGDRLFANTL